MDTSNNGPPAIKKVKRFFVSWARSTATNLGVAFGLCLAVLFATLLQSAPNPDSPAVGTTARPLEEVRVVAKMPAHLQ